MDTGVRIKIEWQEVELRPTLLYFYITKNKLQNNGNSITYRK